MSKNEVATTTAKNVNTLLSKNKAKIAALMPSMVQPERLFRIAVTAISTNPALGKCSEMSLFQSILKSSMMGLEPNGPLGQAYLVPYGSECTLIPGYRGLIDLARRSGDVTACYAHAVYEHDTFAIELGTEKTIKHQPCHYSDGRGEMIGAYAVFKTKDDVTDFEYMTKKEIDDIRGRSKASRSGPWVTDYDEMAKKTVIRRLAKRMPMSVDFADAIQMDNQAAMGERVDLSGVSDVIEGSAMEVPSESEQQAERVSRATAAAKESLASA